MKKIIASAAALLLAVGIVGATTVAASATSPAECVPSEAIPAWTEDVPDIEHPAVYETVVVTPATEGTPAVWANFSPNDQQATFVGPAVYPTDERGTWHDHGTLPPGQAGPDGVYANGNPDKGGNWFYRQAAIEGTDEVTEERLVTEAYTEVTPDIEHPAVPAVECPEEPVVVAPQACLNAGAAYTEGDDLAPVATPAGLRFDGGSGKAVGIRWPVTGNLQGWAPVSFVNTGGTSEFFFRIVIDASADGGPAYKSLSFPGYSTVDSASISYQYGESIAATAERFPHATITSVGFQTNSGAATDYTATLASVTGPCVTVDFTYVVVPEKPADVVTSTTETSTDCETDTVTTTTTTTTIGHMLVDNVWVEAEPVVSTTTDERAADDVECPPVVTPEEPEEPVTPTEPEEPAAPAKPANVQRVAPEALAVTGGVDLTPYGIGAGALLIGGLALVAGAAITRKRATR